MAPKFVIICTILAAVATTRTARASQIKGQAQLGVSNANVKYKNDQTGEGTNDRIFTVGRLNVEVSQFGIRQDRVLFDVRDKYDFFGAVDPNEALLKERNSFTVRSAAYQRPYETSPLYFTLGRFALIQADIPANDGAELGYRLGDALRVGAFAGLAPADIYDPIQAADDTRPRGAKATQGGIYAGFNRRDGATGTYLDSVTSFASVPGENGQTEVFVHNSNTIFFNERHFLFSYMRGDIGPMRSLRRAIINYNYLSKKVRASLSVTQNDPTRTPLLIEPRNTLQPSITRGLRANLEVPLTQPFALASQVSYAMRTQDGLTRTEYQLGGIFRGKVSGAYQLGLYGGTRKNYSSDDRFARINAAWSAGRWSLNASQYLAKEKYHDNTNRTVTMTDGDFGREIGRSLRLAAGARYLKDDTVTITSLLVHIAYIFGRRSGI